MKFKSTHQAMLFVLWGITVIGSCVAAFFIDNGWFWSFTSLLMLHHIVFSNQVAEDIKAQLRREMDELDCLCRDSADDDEDWQDDDENDDEKDE